ncbi:hypothetical protein PENTCL1PPCAC_21653, partial [Pristionchus entomophagus]
AKMQLKLFQYKQVEETVEQTGECRKKRCCSAGLLKFLLAIFVTLALVFVYVAIREYRIRSGIDEEIDRMMNSDKVFHRELELQINQYVKKDDSCKEVKSCLVDYYSLWDLDARETLPPYIEYFHKLQDNFENLGEFAIDLICLAQEEMKLCIGSIDDSCLSVNSYTDTFGLSKLDAREYAADLRVRDFECKNEDFLKDNFKCLYPTTQNRKYDLDVCSANLRKAYDVKRGTCYAIDEYISCAREIFVEECGSKVSGFICQIIKTAMEFNYPICTSVFQTCE